MSHMDGGVDENSGACDVDDEFDENLGAVVVSWLYCRGCTVLGNQPIESSE